MKGHIYEKCMVLFVLILFFSLIGSPIISSSKEIDNTLFINKNRFKDKDVDTKIEKLLRLCHVPSLSVSIVSNNTTVLRKGYGFYDIKNKKTVENDTIYPIGSVTKLITATAIMQLVENESYDLDLDDDVSKYLGFNLKNPNFPDVNITLRMLLAHQSSLSEPFFSFCIYFSFFGYSYSWLKEYLLENGSFYNPHAWNNYAPGEDVYYSSVGIELLGFIIERLTGLTYNQYCKKYILEPLEMDNSSFYLSDFKIENIAKPYTCFIFKYIELPHIQSKTFAMGGLKSTPSDLSHFLIAYTNQGVYNNKRVLKKETIDEMFTIQYPKSYVGGTFRFGLGWYFWEEDGEKYCAHGGLHPGYRAELRLRLSDNTGIIYFWNQCHIVLHFIRSPFFERYFYKEIHDLLFEKADEIIV